MFNSCVRVYLGAGVVQTPGALLPGRSRRRLVRRSRYVCACVCEWACLGVSECVCLSEREKVRESVCMRV